MAPLACISIDVDTLASIYKGKGIAREGGYTFIELRTGLETISRFFGSYGIHCTLFMVGMDFIPQSNHSAIKEVAGEGHELANHSMTHPQGFRWLSGEQKEKEIADMGAICEAVTGIRPIGFRSPGWNIDDSALPILTKLGYRYDSSIFPTLWMPVMKLAHWISMFRQPKPDRSTMGMWKSMFAPLSPYQTSPHSLARKGDGGLVEFPLSVTPCLRIPFFATMLLFLGNGVYKAFYRRIRSEGLSIHFQMHLSDFVDYTLPELQAQMPPRRQGVYIPESLTTPLEKKLMVFRQMIELIARDYTFVTLKEWAARLEK